jgi:hypothetical protein
MRPACGNLATTPALSCRQGTLPVCSLHLVLRLRPLTGTILLTHHPTFRQPGPPLSFRDFPRRRCKTLFQSRRSRTATEQNPLKSQAQFTV